MSESQLEALKATGTKYRRELLAMPMAKLEPITKHMTVREGVQGKEVVGEIKEEAELRPYRSEKAAVEGLPSVALRELETFLGDVVREFDPNLLLATILGGRTSDDITTLEICRLSSMLMASRVSDRLARAIFTAKRNPAGQTSMDLFNGFVTIINNEIVAQKISESNRNLAKLPAVDNNNAVDCLMEAYLDAADDLLQEQRTKFFVPIEVYNAYNRDYQAQFGCSPFNKEYKKVFLEGTDETCELVKMSGLRDTKTCILTTKENMLVGCDRTSDKTTAQVRGCDNPKAVQFFMKMFFGVEFESISSERFLVCKLGE